jgi:glycosyltransferase involved in cell wall biosynthesis
VKLSVCIITLNEEANIGRTLKSVQPLVADGQGEIIVVDSGSTDKTVEIAKSFGAKVFTEPWKGFAAQKNSALEKAQGEWVFSLDADEEVTNELAKAISLSLEFLEKKELNNGDGYWLHNQVGIKDPDRTDGFTIRRRNFFLGRPLRWGGFYPDAKLRLVRRPLAKFESRSVHEDMMIMSEPAEIWTPILHHAYPTLSGYIEHMNKYSSLGAEMEIEKGRGGFSLINIVIRPWLTFIYNYFSRLGFLDGKEGLLLHIYHAVYVSWKYAKVWELGRSHHESKKNAAS